MERKENYCNVGRMTCNRTEKMSCGGCITAIAGCTESLRDLVGSSFPWRGMQSSSTTEAETLTLYDPNGNLVATATVRAGNLLTTDNRPTKKIR